MEVDTHGINSFLRTWVGRDDYRQLELRRHGIKYIHQLEEILVGIDVLFAVSAHDKKFTRL
ncbi:hypothetical protein D3C79_1042660 [compost metagenome]